MTSGISSIGVKLGYAVETAKGVKPTSYKTRHRINSIGEISITPETIDASALEDPDTRSVPGRGSNGGTWNIVVNVTNETIAEWKEVITDYIAAKATGMSLYFVVYHPELEQSYFVKAKPPEKLPLSGIEQNSLSTMTIALTIDEYIGMDAKIEPTEE